ncbi:MAG TPA: zinc ABC transporter substrate-binding protein [Candidatus Binatia bacterium]|nr:zinc ABC transporter substrate-binding protein [Candidatus Binatia bacterium]
MLERRRRVVVLAAALGAAFTAGCGAGTSADPGGIQAVGAENEYADVISQIGGEYVDVTAIMSNPNTDPHSFEASPAVARTVSTAQLVVQDGVGYDGFMNQIEAAAPSSSRKVIDVQTLLGLPDSTPNPHLWYRPSTMPAVARAIAGELGTLQPDHSAYFQANLQRFDSSLTSWTQAIAGLKASYRGAPVAVTEPVPDYLLQAAGLDIITPWAFQADIMNGVDPSAQDVSLMEGCFANHQAKVLLYNQQVTDSLTQSLLQLAHQNHVPVVGVYETMPTPGYDYQSWMLAEVDALRSALAHGQSTTRL